MFKSRQTGNLAYFLCIFVINKRNSFYDFVFIILTDSNNLYNNYLKFLWVIRFLQLGQNELTEWLINQGAIN